MPDTSRFLLCLLVMAGVTYLIRMLPLVFFDNPSGTGSPVPSSTMCPMRR